MRSVTVVCLLVMGAVSLFAEPAAPPAKITISKETTRISGPLDADGFVDYVGAIDVLNEPGITDATDAGTVWRAEFVHGIPTEIERMGLDPAKLPTDRFRGGRSAEQDLAALLAGKLPEPADGFAKAFGREWGVAYDRPWKKADAPVIAAWLDANANALTRIAEAGRRPHYRIFVNRKLHGVAGQPLMSLLKVRNAANAFHMRALRHVGEGNRAAAVDDVLSALRLRRLAEGHTLIENLLGATVQGIALDVLPHLYADGALPEAERARLLAGFSALRPLPTPLDVIDRAERWAMLDVLTQVAKKRGDAPSMIEVLGVSQDPALKWMDAAVPVLDFDEALREVNETYDLSVAAARTPGGQGAALREKLSARLQAKPPAVVAAPDLAERMAKDPAVRREASRAVGAWISTTAVPSTGRSLIVWNEAQVQETLARAALEALGKPLPKGTVAAVQHGYTIRQGPGSDAVAITAVPLVKQETGVRAFCLGTTSGWVNTTDGSEPKVEAGRCIPTPALAN